MKTMDNYFLSLVTLSSIESVLLSFATNPFQTQSSLKIHTIYLKLNNNNFDHLFKTVLLKIRISKYRKIFDQLFQTSVKTTETSKSLTNRKFFVFLRLIACVFV